MHNQLFSYALLPTRKSGGSQFSLQPSGEFIHSLKDVGMMIHDKI
jgi:hypothetical protein